MIDMDARPPTTVVRAPTEQGGLGEVFAHPSEALDHSSTPCARRVTVNDDIAGWRELWLTIAPLRRVVPGGALWARVCRRLAKTPVRTPRPSGIELVDVHTRLTHRVSPDELLAGRARGDYEALCGARLLAASLTDPGRGQCQECTP